MTRIKVLGMVLVSICIIMLLFGACSAPQSNTPKNEPQQSRPQPGTQPSATGETSQYDEVKERLALYLDDYSSTQLEKCNSILSKLDLVKEDKLDELMEYMDNIAIIDEVLSHGDNWDVKKTQEGVYSISGPGLGFDLDNLINGEWTYDEKEDMFTPIGIPAENLLDTLTCPK